MPVTDGSPSRKIFVIVNTLALAALTTLSILPLIHIFAMSLSDKTAVAAGAVKLLPRGLTTFSYTHIFRNPMFMNSFLVSVARVLMGVPINMLCIVMVAYPLSRTARQFPARKYYIWFFIVTMLFHGGMVPTYMIVLTTGIYDTIWALLIPRAVSVFYTLILLNFFRGLPADLTEAAMIDGAGHMTVLIKIMIPLSKAALATLVLFSFVDHWNSWFDGLIYINNRNLKPLQTYLQSILVRPDLARMDAQEREYYMRFNLRSIKTAQIFITIVPILMIYPFLQRYYTKGIVLGSLKG